MRKIYKLDQIICTTVTLLNNINKIKEYMYDVNDISRISKVDKIQKDISDLCNEFVSIRRDIDSSYGDDIDSEEI